MENDEKGLGPEGLMENLLAVLPYWHRVIDRGVKQSLSGKMSLESYYCLQLLRRSGAITMSELAARLRISRQQATQTVQRLYDYQFVRRTQDDADRRCVKIEITERAEDYIDRAFHRDAGFLAGRGAGGGDLRELARAVEILLRVLPAMEEPARERE